jgi:hypothetical protein
MSLVRRTANCVGDNCDWVSEVDGPKDGGEDTDIRLGPGYYQSVCVPLLQMAMQ